MFVVAPRNQKMRAQIACDAAAPYQPKSDRSTPLPTRGTHPTRALGSANGLASAEADAVDAPEIDDDPR